MIAPDGARKGVLKMRYLGKGSVASFLRVMLNIAWYFLFVIIGLVLIGVLTVAFFGPKLVPHGVGANFNFGAEFISFSFSQVQLQNPQAIFLGFLGWILAMFSVAQAVIYQLRKIFATLRDGSAFTRQNARRVRSIGLIIIGGSVLQSIVNYLVGWVMMNNITIPGVEINATSDLHLGGVFMGLLILVLGEIFRQGASLQEDQNLTI
jgi:hypothetical protein